METPKQVVKGRPFLGRHVAHEGIREWFVREDWLLTDREVELLLTLSRAVAARYYYEWGAVDPSEWSGDLSATNSKDDATPVE
jgi:hypothetical protein